MARARNIKPGFFTNDKLAENGPHAMLLFEALWCLADRSGRLEDRPKKIKIESLPYFDVDIDDLLDSLAKSGFIIRYSVDETRYIQVQNFSKHQNPHVKEPPSTIPAPDEYRTSTVQEPEGTGSSPADSGFRIPDSGLPYPEEPAQAPETPPEPIKGDEANEPDNNGKGKKSALRKKPLTFCPATFPLEDRHYTYGAEKGLTRPEIERATEKFLNWHTSKQTQYGDWYRTWQNWIIGTVEDKEKVTPFPNQAQQSPEDARLERTRKRIAYLERGEWDSFTDRETFKGEAGQRERQRQLDFFRNQLADLERKAGAA